jgi:hypothetical protein
MGREDIPSRLLKNLSESFDGLRTNGEREFEMIEKIPFMLRLSKHSVSFFRGSGVAI